MRLTLISNIFGLGLTAVLLAFSPLAHAGKTESGLNPTPASLNSGTPEKGWFFFESPPKPAPAPSAPMPQKPRASPVAPASAPAKDPCLEMATWTPSCGFVDPGTSFEFQAKERDQLLNAMSMSKNDPKAVEAFQYYMKWVLSRTSEITNLWWYNMTQNQDLDPTVKNPITSFGLQLAAEVTNGSKKQIFDVIKKEGGFFVLFSRNDCFYCHQMVAPMQLLAKQTGLEVRNASLDNECLKEFSKGCMTAPGSIQPAEALHVTTVPTLFLYIPKNTWIRIATGITDTQSMEDRAYQFFTAYRNALLKGINNGINGAPSVDFSGNGASGNAAGVGGVGGLPLPSETDISQLVKSGTLSSAAKK